MGHWSMGVKTTANTSMVTGYSSVLPTYAINFGSGDRNASMQTITINTYASNMHVVNGFTSSQTVVEPSPYSYSVELGVDTGHYKGYDGAGIVHVGDMRAHSASNGTQILNDPFMPSANLSSPRPWEGILFHFNHDVAVAVSPVTLHFGSGDPVTDQSKSCHVKALELASVAPFKSGGAFKHITPSSKLTLTSHLKTSTGHSWWTAIVLKPTAVSFHSSGRLKIEGTFY